MENMESDYRNLFREVSPSVVLVEQVGHTNNFCIGSVILNEGESTFILTGSKLLDLSANLSVTFSNGCKQPATPLIISEKLCILMTKLYQKCKVIEFFSGDINHTYAAAIAPATKSSVYKLPCFVIHKSLETGTPYSEDVTEGSQDSFTFQCLYGDRGPNGVSRLMCGPVFNMEGKVLGFVSDDMEYKFHPKGNDGQIVHGDYYVKIGYSLKIGTCASILQKRLGDLVGDVDWKKGLLKAKAQGAPY
uniref:Uncharacterized protein n=1 Tax=Arundo donax TaxID=35708 RepID=A0A0A8Y0A4_ARUDO